LELLLRLLLLVGILYNYIEHKLDIDHSRIEHNTVSNRTAEIAVHKSYNFTFSLEVSALFLFCSPCVTRAGVFCCIFRISLIQKNVSSSLYNKDYIFTSATFSSTNLFATANACGSPIKCV
jgi:protein tyrosine phosphatase